MSRLSQSIHPSIDIPIIYIVNHPSIISQDLLEFTIVISFTTFFNSPRRFLHGHQHAVVVAHFFPHTTLRPAVARGKKKVENLQQQHVHIKITPSEKKTLLEQMKNTIRKLSLT